MVSFAYACRLCLRKEPGNVEILSLEGQRRLLPQNLWKYFSIWIGVEEHLPKTVCQLCIGQIENFTAFCTNVENVQKIIQQRISHTSKTIGRDASFSNNYIKVDYVPNFVIDTAEEDQKKEVAENGRQSEMLTNAGAVVKLEADTVAECDTLNVNDMIDVVKHEDVLYNRDSNLMDDEIACMDLPATDDSQSRESVKDRKNAELASFYTFCCRLCKLEETFDKYEILDEHCQTQHGKRGAVVCCGRQLIGRETLLQHMKKHFQQLKCPECGKRLANRYTLKLHILAIHHPSDKRPYKCKQCPKGFVTKEYLQRHEEIHQEKAANLSFVCDTCGKRYPNSSSLHTHELYAHKRSNSAMCHICAKTFPMNCYLQQHLKRMHDADRECFKCSECGKMLRNKDTLRSHMRLHKGELFKCTQCSRVFKSASGLRSHRLYHSNKWPHQCHVCKKLFRRKGGLTAHLIIHTGEQPFQCPHCPRTFASQSNYYTHKLRMHTKRVEQDDNETVVVQVTDTGEKQYQCPSCPQTFTNMSNCYTHKLRKHISKVPPNTSDLAEENITDTRHSAEEDVNNASDVAE